MAAAAPSRVAARSNAPTSTAIAGRLRRALELLELAREAAAVTPTAAAWRAVAEAEHDRARAQPNPAS